MLAHPRPETCQVFGALTTGRGCYRRTPRNRLLRDTVSPIPPDSVGLQERSNRTRPTRYSASPRASDLGFDVPAFRATDVVPLRLRPIPGSPQRTVDELGSLFQLLGLVRDSPTLRARNSTSCRD